jgi:hypothetical protein
MKKPPFNRIVNFVTFLLAALSFALAARYGLETHDMRPLTWVMPFLYLIALVGMKFAAPLLPWQQASAAVGTVVAISILSHGLVTSVPLLHFFFEQVIGCICVWGFGDSWVRKGYLNPENNTWE